MLRLSPPDAPSCDPSTCGFACVLSFVAIRPPRSGAALPAYLLTVGFSANGELPRGLARRLESRDQRAGVEGAAVQAPADEEARRAGHPARQAAVDVPLHAWRVDVRVEFAAEALRVEAEIGGLADQVVPAERAARLVHRVVHLPEGPLGGGRLGRLGGALGVGVNLTKREMAK